MKNAQFSNILQKSVVLLFTCILPTCFCAFMIDDIKGLGRRFDGIGGLSGGGATSKLLMNYKEPYRTQILDYLFKPNFGASLQILKVEIGGDSQSTDGAEASHMHSANDENYNRGYEWWLMTEAKKRNPDIKLYGLPWVWPGWLGGAKPNPFSNITNTVTYITNWIRGAKKFHNLTIDYIGIWNERPYDVTYIKVLRSTLDKLKLGHVQIVAADGEWGIVADLSKDADLLNSVGAIGVHYPGSHSTYGALVLEKPLWASEEYSALNDQSGGGCWARVLNEGYVNGLLTAAISWNLIASYYDDLPYGRSGLMTANHPWSGTYDVNSPIWMSAHFTQFSAPGWRYLPHGAGVGNLTNGGSYTAMTDGKQLSIFIVTMDPSKAPCFYHMPKYIIAKQIVQFQLAGSFAHITELNMWYSKLNFTDQSKSQIFKKKKPVKVGSGGVISMELDVNEVYTLTTLSSGNKGFFTHQPSNISEEFPVPYSEDFQNYSDSAEAFNFAQQAGVFEVRSLNSTHKVLAQVVPQPPIDTCLPKPMTKPVNLIGNYNWSDVDVSMDFMLPGNGTTGIFLGARVSEGGCNTIYSNGIYTWILGEKTKNTTTFNLVITSNFSRSVVLGTHGLKISVDKWYTLGLTIQDTKVTVTLSGKQVLSIPVKTMPSKNGFVAIGTETFQLAYFDNFKVKSAKVNPAPAKPRSQRGINDRDRYLRFKPIIKKSEN